VTSQPTTKSTCYGSEIRPPFWPIKNGPLGHYVPLNQDVDCEIAIVEARITGALVAYYLAQEGIPTVIVDRREIGTGSTGATTGLLQYEVDRPLFELIGRVARKSSAELPSLSGSHLRY